MVEANPKILVISSADPYVGSGHLLLEYRQAFQEAGVDADYLTLNPVEGYSDIMYAVDPRGHRPFRVRLRNYIKNHFVLNWRFFQPQGDHYFFYRWEEFPPVSNYEVMSKLGNHYDIIVILFWQKMLSFSSIRALYRKYHCKILFMCADYSPMSGGCHFTCDCDKYKTGCHHCEGVHPLWANRFAEHNVRYRKKVYDEVQPVVFGNTFMQSYFKESYLLRNTNMKKSSMIIDIKEFCPQDNRLTRQEFGICDNYSYILSCGSTSLNDQRKGFQYLLDALQLAFNELNDEERNKVLILTIGNDADKINDCIPFDAKHLGMIPFSDLPKFYSVSTSFLCPSIFDAGPMMVNQALCCGTPVVAFDMGAAMDCVKGQNTGFCVPLKDTEAYGKAIVSVIRQSDLERNQMRINARKYAENHFSYKAKVDAILSVFESNKTI